jgi:hypothetical protein
VHLARLEGKVFFEELLDAFSTIELIGEPPSCPLESEQHV